MESRHDRHGPELPEVFIERKRPLDAEPLHDDAAGAIGEAPLFVVESLKNTPSIRKILILDGDNLGKRPVDHFRTKCEHMLVFATGAEQRQRLVHHVIARYKSFLYRRKQALRVR